MNAEVVQLSPIRTVMLRHVGPYEELSPQFDRLWSWVASNSIPAGRTIGIYWDNPDFTPPGKLRSAACVEVPPAFRMMATNGLPLELGEITGGQYVTLRYVGPYEGLARVWSDLTTYTERTLRRKITDDPAFEVYVNDASETPPNALITDLYMPVR